MVPLVYGLHTDDQLTLLQGHVNVYLGSGSAIVSVWSISTMALSQVQYVFSLTEVLVHSSTVSNRQALHPIKPFGHHDLRHSQNGVLCMARMSAITIIMVIRVKPAAADYTVWLMATPPSA
jgi:hypothetical protein